MKNLTWINIYGISNEEILEDLGFVIKNDRVTRDGIVYCLDLNGNQIYEDAVLAVIGGKNNEFRLITDVSELEDDDD